MESRRAGASKTLDETALHGAAQRTFEQDANELIEFLTANGANLDASGTAGGCTFDLCGFVRIS